MSFTFALGTAARDLTASALHFGFAGSIVLFTVMFAVPALARWRFRLNGVLAFWCAYIITRPLGASVADWLSKAHNAGGMGYGDGTIAALLLAITLYILTYAPYDPTHQQVAQNRRSRWMRPAFDGSSTTADGGPHAL